MVYARAFEDGKIDRNPLARVRWLSVQSREANPLSSDEVSKILSELGRRSVEVRSYFQFAFATGLRTSELIALAWSDIDLSAKRASVTKAKVRGYLKEPKTAAGRRFVFLNPEAVSALTLTGNIASKVGEVFVDPKNGKPGRMTRR